MSNYRFILSGGGTGGHIYPAIAIADGLKKAYPEASFLFVGALGKMEMQKVPAAGYQIKGLWITGLSRTWSLSLLLFPFKLWFSLVHSLFILLSFKPSAVIGTGGYASAPLLKMAQILGYPTLIQEQNSYAGITNKWLAKKAKAICVAYPNMERYFPKESICITGNPIRANIAAQLPLKETALSFFGLKTKQPVLLVLGGSSGAKKINEYIGSALAYFEQKGIQILWQCGHLYYESYKKHQSNAVKVNKFINQMPMAYAAADVVVSRAGAGAISELMLVGKPTMFVPSPNVAEDHQTKNAKAMAALGAGILVREKDLPQQFKLAFESLLQQDTSITALTMKAAAKPNATAAIVGVVAQMISKNK